MRIAEIARDILRSAADMADNYPDVWESYEIVESMRILDSLATFLADEQSQEIVPMSHDYSTEEIINGLSAIYSRPHISLLDCWIESFCDEHEIR